MKLHPARTPVAKAGLGLFLAVATAACGAPQSPDNKTEAGVGKGMDAPAAASQSNVPISTVYWYLRRAHGEFATEAPGTAPLYISAGATYEPETDWYALGFSCQTDTNQIVFNDYGGEGMPTRTELRIPSARLTLAGSSEAWESGDVAFTARSPASDPFWRAFLDNAGTFEVRTEGWGEEAFAWDAKIGEVLRSCGL